MQKFKDFIKKVVLRHGSTIMACAFAFAFIAANSACTGPYYEPEEPEGLEKLKKF